MSITEKDIKKLTISQLIKTLSIGAWICFIAVLIVAYKLGYNSGVSKSSSNEQEMAIEKLPSSRIDITGKVVDIFDNPRDGVVVVVKGIHQSAITDKRGQYHLSNIPFQNNIVLEAYYGKEKDEISLNLSRDNIEETVTVPDLLILNPINIEVFLCKDVVNIEGKGLVPKDKFETENPQISLDSLFIDEENRFREIWCFVKVIGPLQYEVGKKTEISYEWYYNNEIQSRPFKQSVGVSPFGWRSRASKKVWAGEWLLKIKTKHLELARIPFEIY